MQRRNLKQTTSLNQRLEEQAKRLRLEAKGIPPGFEREKAGHDRLRPQRICRNGFRHPDCGRQGSCS